MKYYYDDPLKAAWMVDKFNMRFPIPVTKYRPHGNNYTVSSLVAHINKKEFRRERYYVHPDDAHILEPQVGDLLDFPAAQARFEICKANGDNLTELHQSFARYKISKGQCLIIQRNGVAFMWPEVES